MLLVRAEYNCSVSWLIKFCLVVDNVSGGKTVPVNDSFALLLSSKVSGKYCVHILYVITKLESLVRLQQEMQSFCL